MAVAGFGLGGSSPQKPNNHHAQIGAKHCHYYRPSAKILALRPKTNNALSKKCPKVFNCFDPGC